MLSLLARKIKQLDDGMKMREAENTTILRELEMTRGQVQQGILCPSIHQGIEATEEEAVSSIAARHAAATSCTTRREVE